MANEERTVGLKPPLKRSEEKGGLEGKNKKPAEFPSAKATTVKMAVGNQ